MSITQGGVTDTGADPSGSAAAAQAAAEAYTDAAIGALGTAAALDVGTGAGNIPQLDGSGKLLDSVLSGAVLVFNGGLIEAPLDPLIGAAVFTIGEQLSAGYPGGTIEMRAGHGFSADASHNSTYGGNTIFRGGQGGNGTASRAGSDGGNIFFFGGSPGGDSGAGTGINGNIYIGSAFTTNVTIGSASAHMGFFGQAPTAQPTMGAATAGGTWTGTEQTMLQTLWNNLRALGLGT